MLLVAILAASPAVLGCGSSSGSGLDAGEPLPQTPLFAMVAGNDVDADRVNLVFAPWGWDDQDRFVELVRDVLSWDGSAYLIGPYGAIVDDADDAFDAGIGVFGIEPWRSMRSRFNVWYTAVEPDTPVSWINDPEPDPFGLPDQVIVTVALDAGRFNPDLASVSGQDVVFEGPAPPTRPDHRDPFANATVVIESAGPAWTVSDIAHELGHAMFNLADEYVGERFGFDGRPSLASWPACAQDAGQAEQWWGDRLGDVDPMVDVWIAEMDRAGFPLPDPRAMVDLVEVTNVDGGCYGVDGSYRATRDSLMNSQIPVLGTVNRTWAERILELWSG